MITRLDKRNGEIVGPPERGRLRPQRIPVAGAVATLDDGGQAKKTTLTRVALLGPLALAAKKDRGKLYLTVINGEHYLVEEIPRKQAKKAHELVAAINAASGAAKGEA